MNIRKSGVTPRFLKALTYAAKLHAADVRKGTTIPYIAHLLSVCALVLMDGGSEEEAVAALLHDSFEDHPEEVSREMIAQRFGQEVLAIVEACTDTPRDYKGGPKPPWRERKSAYLEHINSASPGALRVSLADKLDNAWSILAEYRTIGDKVWSRFNAGKEDQLWYYRSVVSAFRARGLDGFLLRELEDVVTQLEKATQAHRK